MKALRSADTAPVFAALGDPIRLTMVTRLSAAGPQATMQLKEATKVSRQAVTKHLQILESAGLVASERVGRDRCWRIETRKLKFVRAYLERIAAQWDEAVERLRAIVEED